MFQVILLILLLCNLSKSDCNTPLVKIQQGFLTGKYWKSFEGRSFVGFTAIPYAKPPINELRFQAPVPIEPWDGILNATNSHHACPQTSAEGVVGNEDCLYLNVYTPKVPSDEKNLLPVMFFMHGGTYETGSGKPEWMGPKYFLDQDIVLVVINYRLGALGFLSTTDEVVPGNNGLKDQNVALKWTKNNIAQFGGDPNKITSFGNSAGARSSHLHTISPMSKGLINKVILQSGSVTAHYSFTSNEMAKENLNKLGTLLNCPTTSTLTLISCLRAVEASDIVKASAEFIDWDGDSTNPFQIVIEENRSGAFLTESPVDSIKSGKASNVPFMMGITAQEAAYKATFLNANPDLLETLENSFDVLVPPIFGMSSDEFNSSRRIRDFYFDGQPVDSSKKLELANMLSDSTFVYSHSTTVNLHAQFTNSTVYQYLFGYRGSASYADLFGDSDFVYGPSHTDELLHLFSLGHTFPNYEPTENDIKMIKTLISLWTNFATTGNPTPDGHAQNVPKWDPIGKDGLEYYHIKNFNNITMEKGLFVDRMEFCRSLPIYSFKFI